MGQGRGDEHWLSRVTTLYVCRFHYTTGVTQRIVRLLIDDVGGKWEKTIKRNEEATSCDSRRNVIETFV